MLKTYNFRRIFFVCFALLGTTICMKAATVENLQPITSTCVYAFDDYTNSGTASRAEGAIFGSNRFLDVTGGSVSTTKGSIDIANTSNYAAINGADPVSLSATYTIYGSHLNSFRLKNAQDVIALKPIANSKIYLFGNGNNKTGVEARIPKFATDAALTEALNNAPDAEFPTTGNYVYEFEVPEDFDGTKPLYIGSYNGDAFFSFIIVECPKEESLYTVTITGTPMEGGLFSIKQEKLDEVTEKVVVTATPNDGYAFKEWQDGEGTVLSTENPYSFDITADAEIVAVYESLAVSVGETPATVLVKNVYDVTGCVTKGENQLIDSSHDGDYIKFDIVPTVAGRYSFTSMIGTKNDGMGVTLGYIDNAGNYIESEKKDITNSKNWNSGEDYTWEFDLEEAGRTYTFKVLCHAAGSYCVNLFEMEVVRLGDVLPVYTATFSKGDDESVEGVPLPASVSMKSGKIVTVPANFTLYKDGSTLVGWTDGNQTYTTGGEITLTGNMTLTPVFAENTVSLSERTEDVSITWDFQQKNGAPIVAWEGGNYAGAVWVTQAEVNGKVIDVKMAVDVSSGKVANANWTDWAQLNGGTRLTIPVCTGAVVKLESYSATTTTTIAGEIINQGTKTPSYIYEGTAKEADIVIGDGSYWRTVQVALPALHLTIDDGEQADFNPPYENYASVTYNRSIAAGAYGTICLPFAPDAASLEAYNFYELTASTVNGTEGEVTFTKVDAPEANKPYIYRLADGAVVGTAITCGATEVSAEAGTTGIGLWEMVGSFTNQEVDCTDKAIYALNGATQKLMKVTQRLTVPPYRAYIQGVGNSINETPQSLTVRISGPTGIEQISAADVEGLLPATIYDLMGRPVQNPQKGHLYIQGGKKVVY